MKTEPDLQTEILQELLNEIREGVAPTVANLFCVEDGLLTGRGMHGQIIAGTGFGFKPDNIWVSYNTGDAHSPFSHLMHEFELCDPACWEHARAYVFELLAADARDEL